MIIPASKQRIVVGAAILILVVGFFSPCLSARFTNWDDNRLLTENALVRSLAPQNIGAIFKTPMLGTYIPLTVLSFAVEYRLVGYQPFLYHLVNLLLHMAATFMVFWLAGRLGFSVLGAAVAATLFGIHPMHVESVAWVAQRKDVLCAVFYLGAMLAYCSFLQGLGRKRLGLATGFALAAMLAKPMAVSLPFVFLLMDWHAGRRFDRRVFLEKIPAIVVVGMLAFITLISSQKVFADIPRISGISAVIVYLWNFIFYLSRFAFPVSLRLLYEPPAPISLANPGYFLPVLCFILLVALVVVYRREKIFIFAMFFYVITILPVMRYGMIYPVGMVGDRFMYLPSLGFCLLAGFGAQKLWVWARDKGSILRAVVMDIVVLIFLLLGVKAFWQCRVWHDGVSLWESVLKEQPVNPVANSNLADYLLNRGEASQRVVDLCLRALQTSPDYAEAHINLSSVLNQLKRFDAAMTHARIAIELKPDSAVAYNNLGGALNETGDYQGAIGCFQKALDLNFRLAGVYFNLGLAQQRGGDLPAARQSFEKALATDPGFTLARDYWQRLKQ